MAYKDKDKEGILKQFETSMDTESAQSHGLFTYHPKVSQAKKNVISDYTNEIRRQLSKFISPIDPKVGFGWIERDGQWGYGFVIPDGVNHVLNYQFDNDTKMMQLYMDEQVINNVKLDTATKTTMELELYAELWLLQHLKEASKCREVDK